MLEFTAASFGSRELVPALLKSLEGLPAQIDAKKDKALGSLLGMMYEEFRARPNPSCLEPLLMAFLVHLARFARPEEAKRSPRSSLVDRFRSLVETHFREQHAVDFYAKNLGTTGKRLTTQAARVLGKSAGAYIQERCLTEAKRLLAYSDLPIAEIGFRLGYEDPNYFARFFRQRSGIAPGKFRDLARHSVPS